MSASERAFPVRRWLGGGVLAVAVLLGGLGAWMVKTPISGAIIAAGSVTVSGHRRPVQHPEGGVIEAMLVSEGDRVAAGATLLRFDGRLIRSERAVIAGQLAELAALRARLLAERDGADRMEVPPDLPPAPAAAFAGQARLFEARRVAIEGQIGQLAERVVQAEAGIAGNAARASALRAERALVAEDAAGQRRLFDQGLTQRTRVTALNRDITRLDGEIGATAAETARLRAEIAETRLAAMALQDDRRERANAELRDVAATHRELSERASSLDETLRRLDVRAPVGGTVIGLRFTSGGAVVRAAEVMLDIVPDSEPLVVEARIGTTDIDAVRPGQPARLRVRAFNQRTTPEIPARVLRVSPDVLIDETTGTAYYTAELRPEATALAGPGGLELVPGMPVDAFLLTEERTAMSYLVAPLLDYFSGAFREG